MEDIEIRTTKDIYYEYSYNESLGGGHTSTEFEEPNKRWIVVEDVLFLLHKLEKDMINNCESGRSQESIIKSFDNIRNNFDFTL